MNQYIHSLIRLNKQTMRIFKDGIKWIKNPHNQKLAAGTIVFSVLTGSYIMKFEDDIQVKTKYVKIEGPRSLYMITTTRNRIYKFDRSTWKMHYSQAELWNSVEKGKRYRVKGFGKRWPFFGMYPNIHSVKELN